MKHYFVYALLFSKQNIELGIFSTDTNIFEGNTEENVSDVLATICKNNEYDISKIKTYAFRKVNFKEEPT